MNIWDLYETYAAPESRRELTGEQRQLLAICDFRQEVNSGGFDAYLRFWGADTAPEALALLPRALGEPWHQVLADALAIFGTANPSTADERAEVLDQAEEADDVLDVLDRRFYELEASQDADAMLSELADGLHPWPSREESQPRRGFFGRFFS